jgi:peptide-methionine (S)-S-oxide reductase
MHRSRLSFSTTALLAGVPFLMALLCVSCRTSAEPMHDVPAPAKDLPAASTSPASGQTRTLVLAGGCFWSTQAVFEKLKGVTDVVAGYAGGDKDTATYEQVSSGTTGHAESVKIAYDPSVISFGTLLRVYFTIFDPTTLNQQGNDVGTNYRSTIFYSNDAEKQVAEDYIKQLNEAHVYRDPIVTSLEPLKGFYTAEEYHQHFADKNPDYPYVQFCDVPKLKVLHEKFGDLLKTGTK